MVSQEFSRQNHHGAASVEPSNFFSPTYFPFDCRPTAPTEPLLEDNTVLAYLLTKDGYKVLVAPRALTPNDYSRAEKLEVSTVLEAMVDRQAWAAKRACSREARTEAEP